MAKRGSGKWWSQQAEMRLSKAYTGGYISPSSGAAPADQGDVRQKRGSRHVLPDQLFESKHRGTYDKPAQSISVKLADFEKIWDEATSEGRDGVLHLSIYAPDSLLVDSSDGTVNLIVRLMVDDVGRERELETLELLRRGSVKQISFGASTYERSWP